MRLFLWRKQCKYIIIIIIVVVYYDKSALLFEQHI